MRSEIKYARCIFAQAIFSVHAAAFGSGMEILWTVTGEVFAAIKMK